MRRLLLSLAAAFAALAAPAHAQERAAPDNLTYISADDAEMNAAIAKARAELPAFFQHVAKPRADESNFAIKYNLAPDAEAEFIWASVVSHRNGVTVATLANNPLDSRYTIGQRVEVRDSEIIDWGYFRGRTMQGHYSTRVLLGKMDEADADSIREALGW